MGFRFSSLVELLEDLERNRFRKASKASKSVKPDHAIIVQWFNRHDAKIKRSQQEGIAFLSCLFLERRPDRSFSMQEKRLASVFGRAYSLGTARLNELRAWKERTPADFPNRLASILAQTEMPTPRPGGEVTLEEINDVLDDIAANVKSSAPTLRANVRFLDPVDALTPILLRLRSMEAKWLVRMLMKSYSPVQIPEAVTMQQFHFLLEDVLKIQSDFGAALDTLNQAEVIQLPRRISKADATVLKARLAGHLVPRVGVMIKRQAYHKARSIKHCCQMAGGKLMSVRQKYDGEYCQVHINMSKAASERIQIFAKSGRDSTQDRMRLHYAIESSVNLQSRSQQCMIKGRCILEGELLIYSRSTGITQPFHKIRKHVQHGGCFLNQEADSPVGLDEQVMIMYYDILLLDHSVLLERPLEERRRCLERLIAPARGLAEIGVQILGSGYERAPNAAHWVLRHPRLHKLHIDRSITHTVSFDELQDMASTAQTAPDDAISQEDREWIAKLERADPVSNDKLDRSQSTTTPTPGRSPASLTTACPTPPRAVSRGSPPAIWSEPSQSVDAASRFFSQESDSPVRSEAQRAVKRRCDEEAEILRRKKRRQTEPGRNGISILDPSPLTHARSFTTIGEARVARTSLIKKTPPWCRPSSSAGTLSSSPFEPAAIFRSTPCKRGEPMPEIVEKSDPRKRVREPLKGRGRLIHCAQRSGGSETHAG